MTRPMTGQPENEQEMTNAVQRANKELNEDVPDDIKNHPLTKESMKDDTDTNDDEETLEEMREFRETAREEENDKAGVYGEPQTDEKEMHVTEDGDTETFTQEEWESRRDTRTRLWRSLERKDDLVWVRIPDWMNDAEINKVKVGAGFYGHKVGETDKAINFEVPSTPESHNATAETVWVPKSQVQVHDLK